MLVNRSNIDPKVLLSRIDDGAIFQKYYGDFEIGRKFSSPFRRDSHPSAIIKEGSDERLYFVDYGTQDNLDSISFVMKLHGLDLKSALHKIASDFELYDKDGNIQTGVIQTRRKSEVKRKPNTPIQIGYESWKDHHLAFWREGGVTEQELIDNFVYPVKTLYINSAAIPTPEDSIRFAYLVKGKEKNYIKVYSPNDPIYKWCGSVPHNLPFGLYELPFASDTLIIAKAQKDRILLKKFFTDVIAVQSETPSMDERLINYLKKKYKRIVIIFDNDEAGLKNLEYFDKIGFKTLHLPEFFLIDFGIKDMWDVSKKFGVDGVKIWLKTQNLL